MPSPRQQRGSNWRGRVQIPNQRPTPDVFWIPQTLIGSDVVIDIDPLVEGWSLDGVPALHCSTPDQMANSASLALNQLTVGFPAAIDTLAYLTLRSADPAVRGPQGAYLAAFRGQANLGPAFGFDVTELAIGMIGLSGTGVDLDISPQNNSLYLIVQAQFEKGPIIEGPTQCYVIGSTLHLEFPTACASGDTIGYMGNALRSEFAGRFTIAPSNLVIP